MAYREPSSTNPQAITGGGAVSVVWNRTFNVDSTAAATTLTLAAAAAFSGQLVEVCKTDATTNAVTIVLTAGTINAVASIILTRQNDAVVLRNDGTNALIVSDNRDRDRVQSVAVDTTLTTWQQTIFVDASGAARTITLPTAVGVDATGNPAKGGRITIKKTDSSINVVTVDGSGAETIDGALTYTIVNQNQSVVLESDGANVRVVAAVAALEVTQEVLVPEGPTTGNATRVLSTTFEGASYTIGKGLVANRLIVRATGQSGAPTMRILCYQDVARAGASGTVANLIATAAGVAVGAAGNFEVSFSEGNVLFQPGVVYILYGRDSALGSITLRTRTTQALDLFTANVDAATYPTSFTTAIAATTSPSTFNPLTQTVASSSDIILAARLLRV
jgi:hypothetical protein